VKAAKQLFEGGVNATVIDTRIIFREAVSHLASSLILAHNHPSGNLKPSQADRKITQKCKEAGKLFDIPVLDHVIISSRGYYSFANSGEMG
ncbi:MAG: JAB domain-containing protein, partial [Bacteroidota bacterium]